MDKFAAVLQAGIDDNLSALTVDPHRLLQPLPTEMNQACCVYHSVAILYHVCDQVPVKQIA